MYSSINYILLSGILEKVTHHSYENLIKNTYIKKLGLSNTVFYWDISKIDIYRLQFHIQKIPKDI